ncbi:hypothetical protein SUBVAR_06412 [Subdoligranulum variabile DSM 15176]|uniref:Uncharacterized protein n=1 Tax=Subdoligranulum variabile DSM 15176 TaxID=411471 RepID=D1PPU5_9FIRM|nr:hypothetical protein SUBVAR_06412 [Subdoligranulum variabile DSM 15176]
MWAFQIPSFMVEYKSVPQPRPQHCTVVRCFVIFDNFQKLFS